MKLHRIIRKRLSGCPRTCFHKEKTPRILTVAEFFNYSKNRIQILPCKFLLSYRIILLELEY
uniref:Uncharacterized protein n=1 Tax=Nomascus leucogenys TaxID=61853 RepID=G1S9C1_NOMLE